jgi:hypothetical protein
VYIQLSSEICLQILSAVRARFTVVRENKMDCIDLAEDRDQWRATVGFSSRA